MRKKRKKRKRKRKRKRKDETKISFRLQSKYRKGKGIEKRQEIYLGRSEVHMDDRVCVAVMTGTPTSFPALIILQVTYI